MSVVQIMWFNLRLAWIGLCALSMLMQTRLVFDLPLTPGWLDGFVFGSAVFAYNFTHPDRRGRATAWLAAVFGGICFGLPLVAPQTQLGTTIPSANAWQGTVCVPVWLWMLYYGFRYPGRAGLRGVPIAKPIVVAFVWAWVTVLLPLPPGSPQSTGLVFLGRSAFIFALALAYDLADLDYDRRDGLATLAGRLGLERTFYFIFGALAFAVLCCCANFFLHIYGSGIATALIASLVVSAWWLWFFLCKDHLRAWQKILIDALMLIQFLIVLGAKIWQ